MCRHGNAQDGAVVSTLFGAVALAGIVGASTMMLIKGPLATAVQANRTKAVETYMTANAGVVMRVSAAKAQDGDCDGDDMVEPLPYKDASPAPEGGGQVPADIDEKAVDPWGTPYGYCVWDHGSEVDDAGCGGTSQNRLPGTDAVDQVSIALISAGKDKSFDTACNPHPDTPRIDKPDGSDDIIYNRTYKQANVNSGGLWKLASDAADRAETTKDARVGTAGAGFGSAQAGVLRANQGLVLGNYDLDSLSPPQVPGCSPDTNDNLMVYNTGSGNTVICDADAGGSGEWQPIAGASAGNFAPVFSEGTTTSITVNEDSTNNDLTSLLEASDLNTSQTLEWSKGDTTPSHGVLDNLPQSTSANIGVTPSGTPHYDVTDTNYAGSDSFAIDLTDGEATTTLNVNVDITPVNDAPNFDDGGSTSITLDEDTTQSINSALSATDVDDNQTLTWSVSSGPSNGSLGGFTATASSGTSDASQTPSGLSYTPNADYNGSDSFEIKVADGNGGTDTITVNVTVDPVNDAPVLANMGNVDLNQESANTWNNHASVSGWGASNESQSVSSYTIANKSTLESSSAIDSIAINNSGDITIDSGSVSSDTTKTVDVRVTDDGGTSNGGSDTSAIKTFDVTVLNAIPPSNVSLSHTDQHHNFTVSWDGGVNYGSCEIRMNGTQITSGNCNSNDSVTQNMEGNISSAWSSKTITVTSSNQSWSATAGNVTCSSGGQGDDNKDNDCDGTWDEKEFKNTQTHTSPFNCDGTTVNYFKQGDDGLCQYDIQNNTNNSNELVSMSGCSERTDDYCRTTNFSPGGLVVDSGGMYGGSTETVCDTVTCGDEVYK